MNYDYGYDYMNDSACGGQEVRGEGKYVSVPVEMICLSLDSKNGVILYEYSRKDNSKVDHYEIYFEDEFFAKYSDKKTAKAMFKDFSA